MNILMFSSGVYVRMCAALAVGFILIQLHLLSYDMEEKRPNLNPAAAKILYIYKRISSAMKAEANIDNSGLYKILPILQRKGNYSSFDLTFVTQCSWNRLPLIENLFKEWQGPVSVAVFSDAKHVEHALWTISVAVHCHATKELDLSLVFPAEGTHRPSHDFAMDMSKKFNESRVCKIPDETLGRRNYNWSVPYPGNLLRNVAKGRSTSDYVLVTDMDMLPNKDLRRNFLRFIWSRKTHPKKVVFVVPIFEMDFSMGKMPRSKAEIISESRKGSIRPFYIIPCRKCHWLTNYMKWFSYPSHPGTRVLYKVEWKHPWEPFFISHRDIPNYDERFKQYGFNRVSQACQLHIEGYSFQILDNVFLIHRGFKAMGDFHDTKQPEMDSNRKLYEEFKREIKGKNPASNRVCDS